MISFYYVKFLQGAIESFNTRAYQRNSRWRAQEAKMYTMVQNNKIIYKGIVSAVSYDGLKYPKINTLFTDLILQSGKL